ncbi:hypothetical protein RBB50_005936 [Rhinocladiella similis]
MIDPSLFDASSYRYVTDIQDTEPTSSANFDLQDFNPSPDDPFDIFNDPSKFVSLLQSEIAEEDGQPGEPSKPFDADNALRHDTYESNLEFLKPSATAQPVRSPTTKQVVPASTISNVCEQAFLPEKLLNTQDFANLAFDMSFKDPAPDTSANHAALLATLYPQNGTSSKKERGSYETTQTYTRSAQGHQPAIGVKTPKRKPITGPGQLPASAPARGNHPGAITNAFISPLASNQQHRRPANKPSPKKTPMRAPSQMVKGYATMPQPRSLQNMPFSTPGNRNMAGVSFNGVSQPASKRVRTNKPQQQTGYITFDNPRGELGFSEVDSIMEGFGDYLKRHSNARVNSRRAAAKYQPFYGGMGSFSLSTYFADPVNFQNNQWIGRSMDDPEPPLSQIRQQTGYDFPIPRVSGILASVKEAEDLLRRKNQADNIAKNPQPYRQLPKSTQPPGPVLCPVQRQTQAYQNTHDDNIPELNLALASDINPTFETEAGDLLQRKNQAGNMTMNTQSYYQLTTATQPSDPVPCSVQEQTPTYQNTHVDDVPELNLALASDINLTFETEANDLLQQNNHANNIAMNPQPYNQLATATQPPGTVPCSVQEQTPTYQNTHVDDVPELNLALASEINPTSETEAALMALGVDVSDFVHTPQPTTLAPALGENESLEPVVMSTNTESDPPHDDMGLGLPSEGLPGFEFDFDMFNENQAFNPNDWGF